MMLLKMCAVFDEKVGLFMPPQFFRSLGEAERTFTDAVHAEGSKFSQHSKDYSFFWVGDYNEEDASFKQSIPTLIITASQVVSNTPRE